MWHRRLRVMPMLMVVWIDNSVRPGVEPQWVDGQNCTAVRHERRLGLVSLLQSYPFMFLSLLQHFGSCLHRQISVTALFSPVCTRRVVRDLMMAITMHSTASSSPAPFTSTTACAHACCICACRVLQTTSACTHARTHVHTHARTLSLCRPAGAAVR